MPLVGMSFSTQRVEAFLYTALGGGDGVMRSFGEEGAVTETDPVSMRVRVGSFRGLAAGRAIGSEGALETEAVAAPALGAAGDVRRIDLVQAGPGRVYLKPGVESAAPVAPSADAGALVLAWVYCRKGMTSVKTVDDAANGYVVDKRAFV